MTQKSFQLDIIIPAYKASSKIVHTLISLSEQEIEEGWSVRNIVINDGAESLAQSQLDEIKFPSPWRNHLLLNQKHAGSGVARNQGIKHSDADIILLLGADILLLPGAIAEHCKFHQHHVKPTQAALGMVKWDPRIPPSPFMEWTCHGGPQNNFDALLGKTYAPPENYFYASHLSIKRKIIANNLFSKKFINYGYEDAELGRRLSKVGMKLHVLHQAIGLHNHDYSPTDIFLRQVKAGKSIVVYQEMYPNEKILYQPAIWRVILYRIFYFTGISLILQMLVVKYGDKLALPRLFAYTINRAFYSGVKMAQQKQ